MPEFGTGSLEVEHHARVAAHAVVQATARRFQHVQGINPQAPEEEVDLKNGSVVTNSQTKRVRRPLQHFSSGRCQNQISRSSSRASSACEIVSSLCRSATTAKSSRSSSSISARVNTGTRLVRSRSWRVGVTRPSGQFLLYCLDCWWNQIG